MASKSISLTPEQREICSISLKKKECLKIHAFAGTGKTTTLVHYSLQHPEKRYLYVAFNKAMQTIASRKFPPHVTCLTVHSLAWKYIGHRFAHKLGSIKPYEVMEWYHLNDATLARHVLDTLRNFLFSSDKTLKSKHVPPQKRRRIDALSFAQRLWASMCDPDNVRVPMEHDGYLKLFQIEAPSLPYDVIFLDEAQDSNPITLAIIKAQKAPSIIVGDTHQQIYQFRGAVDALPTLKSTYSAYLTHSFRFSDSIANVANELLSKYKGETIEIIGRGKGSKVEYVGNRYALLSRTNAGLFDEAVRLHRTTGIYYLGGFDALQPELILDVHALYEQKRSRIKHPFIKKMPTFERLKEYAEDAEDPELGSRVNLVEQYGHDIPMIVNQLRQSAIENPHQAEVCFSTTHRAKGLEFDQVRLNNDFTEVMKEGIPRLIEKVEPEEINILYVAVTRARKCLELNDDLNEFITRKRPTCSLPPS